MAKPTMLQSLLGRPSQTYSFPEEKVYHSTKRDMLRIAAETSDQQTAVLVNDDQPRVIKRPHDVRALDNSHWQLSNSDRGVNHADDSDAEDSEFDVFYTPNTSPRISMASTIAPPLNASIPQPSPQPAVPSTKTSFTHVNTSTTSISSSALDAYSLFSFSNSESTLMTSPVQSDSEHLATRVKTVQEPPQVANGHVNQEWAKDVRWLVPTTAKATTIPSHQSAKSEPTLKSQTRSKPNTPMSKTISKMTPSIMTSMTALLEEDELLDAPALHHPRSSVLISTPRRSGRSRMISHPNRALMLPKKSPSARNTLHHRRSRSLEHTSSSQASSSSYHTSTSASASSHTPSPLRNSKYASSSADPYDPNITSLPIFNAGDLPSQGTPGYTSLVLPRAPVPLSQTSHRPKGIFNLKETRHGADIDGKVDLTRSGVAQTTMASVEVVRGLSAASSSSHSTPSKKFIGLFRRASTSVSPSPGPTSAFGSRNTSQEEDKNGKRPETFSETLDVPLGFTSYRKPPTYVPSGSLLVQVWAVGVDGVDWRLVFGGNSSGAVSSSRSNTLATAAEPRTSVETPPTTPKRSVSLKSTLGRLGGSGSQRSVPSSPVVTPPSTSPASSYTPAAVVGYIPGRSFIGRVLESGWEVGEEVVKKGDWVMGLLDIRKCGALTEFIVVDRRRVHRAPYPRMQQDGLSSLPQATSNVPISQPSSSRMTLDTEPGPSSSSSSTFLQTVTPFQNGRSTQMPKGSNNVWPSPSSASPHVVLPLTLEELALLPGCGISAYRAIRTFAFAFSDTTTEVGGMNMKRVARDALDGIRRRRALVLRGHDGAGAMAVQMLVRRGWRVCVHVPFGCLHYEDDFDGDIDDVDRRDRYRMQSVEERVRAWGGEEVIFDDGEGDGGRGAVVRVIDRLREDGDMFDAVLDTIGGKEVWEAAERLLKVVSHVDAATAAGVGGKKDKTKRTGIGIKQFTTLVGDFPGRTIPSAGDTFKAGLRSLNFGSRTDGKKLEGKVGYAWVSHAQDVDWEGEDIRDTLREVLRIVTETGIRPWVGEGDQWTERTNKHRVVPFEKAHELFASRGSVLANGGSFVVKVVG